MGVTMKRRDFLVGVALLPILSKTAFANFPTIHVSKTPSCECCAAWVQHLRDAGLTVSVRHVGQDALWQLKEELGLTPQISSCHTAQVDRYFIEGHVPAEDIFRLLSERPNLLGLTVPGMPIGTPGMEVDGEHEPYNTLAVMTDRSLSVFAHHP